MTIQHIIAPPLPPLDLPDDEEWTPAVSWGRVLLEVVGSSMRSALAYASSNRDASGLAKECEAAQVSCFLLEHIIVQGGLTAKELATRIPFATDVVKTGKYA